MAVKVIILIFLALLFAVFAFTLRTSVNVGNTGGMMLCVLFAALTIFNKSLSEAAAQSKAVKKLCTVFAVLLIIGAVTAAVVSVMMITYFERPYTGTESTVIVLGCRVGSPMLDKRINAAYKYLCDHPSALCIASGGQGEDERMTEADYIKGRLADMGIDKERIFTEDRSTSTLTNMQYSKKILNEKGLGTRVVIVTSEYHQMRAAMTARYAGLEPYSTSSHTEILYLPTCWLREICAIIVSAIIYR